MGSWPDSALKASSTSFGGTCRPAYWPLNDAIIAGRLRGAAGMPAVLHAGSCVDNSRILKILTDVAAFELDPIEAAREMLRHIDGKSKALKLRPMMHEQPFAPHD